MHILLIHQAYTAMDEPGGTRHDEFAHYLASYGHKVTIIASQVSYLTGELRKSKEIVERNCEQGVRVINAHTYSGWHRSFFHRMLSFFSFMFSSFVTGLRVKDVDIVWGTSPPIFQVVTAWALARLKGVPFLFEVRDLWPAFAVAVGVLRNSLLISASRWLEKFLYNHADRIAVNSPGFISHVKERGGERVVVIPNGSDISMFNPYENGAEYRRENGLEGKYLVMYTGAHGLSNDLGVVLDAAKLLEDREDVAFVMVGDGKEKPALIKKAREMGLSSLYFLPPVPKNTMPTVLAAADACIAILKPIAMYSTVFPNKVFDYMAAGRPVVLAIGGVIREVVEKADAGIPVQPGDAQALARVISKLSSDKHMGKEIGMRGRKYVEENFNRADQAGKLEKLMLDML